MTRLARALAHPWTAAFALVGTMLVLTCSACVHNHSGTDRQSPATEYLVFRTGWINPVMRDSVLAHNWSDSVGQTERVYCATKWRADVFTSRIRGTPLIKIDSQYYVDSITPAPESPEAGGPASTPVTCPVGMPWLHTHPPHTCWDHSKAWTCMRGGYEAYQCQPSFTDELTLAASSAVARRPLPFGVVICGPNEVRFFYPSDFPAVMPIDPHALFAPASP